MGRLTLKQRIFAIAVGALVAAAQAGSPALVRSANAATNSRVR